VRDRSVIILVLVSETISQAETKSEVGEWQFGSEWAGS
jgi:hypothetical protein